MMNKTDHNFMRTSHDSLYFNKEFGGPLLRGRRKSIRPFQRDRQMLCLLKSNWTQQNRDFNSQMGPLHKIIFRQATRFNVQVSIIEFFQDQILFRYKSRKRQNVGRFLKSITGLIARWMAQTEKGTPLKTPFWEMRPWTSVLQKKYWSKQLNDFLLDYYELLSAAHPLKKARDGP